MTEDTKALEPVPANKVTTYKEQVDFAQLMAKAHVLPQHLHGNPGNCLAVITLSQSWGMNPIAVGLCTSVIPKRGGGETLMFEGKLVQAAINNSGLLSERLRFNLSGAGPNTSCEIIGKLKGETEARSLTIGMPSTQNSPLWKGSQSDKEQQLTYLAARTWARRYVPEVMLGVYSPGDDIDHAAPSLSKASRTAVLDHIEVLPIPDLESAPEAIPVAKEGIDQFGIAVCGTCGGRGVVDTEDGKAPCQECSQ
jgi:hypothetical protein